jgi:hypothetical protein
MSDLKSYVIERLGMAVIYSLWSLIAAEGNLRCGGGGADCREAGHGLGFPSVSAGRLL